MLDHVLSYHIAVSSSSSCIIHYFFRQTYTVTECTAVNISPPRLPSGITPGYPLLKRKQHANPVPNPDPKY